MEFKALRYILEDMKLIPHCTVTMIANASATSRWWKAMLNEDHLQISWPQGQTCQLIILLCNSSLSYTLSTSFSLGLWTLLYIYHATFFKLQCMLKEAQANKQMTPSGTLFPSCWIMESSVLLFLTTRYKTGFSFSPQISPLLSFMTVLFSHFCTSCEIEECCLDHKECQILPSPLCLYPGFHSSQSK